MTKATITIHLDHTDATPETMGREYDNEAFAEDVRNLITTADTQDGVSWAWCNVEVCATLGPFTGSAHLCFCSYRSTEDFRQSGYYTDLEAEARRELQAKVDAFVASLDNVYLIPPMQGGPFCCIECGSPKIEQRLMVFADAHTGAFSSVDDGFDCVWCSECEDETRPTKRHGTIAHYRLLLGDKYKEEAAQLAENYTLTAAELVEKALALNGLTNATEWARERLTADAVASMGDRWQEVAGHYVLTAYGLHVYLDGPHVPPPETFHDLSSALSEGKVNS